MKLLHSMATKESHVTLELQPLIGIFHDGFPLAYIMYAVNRLNAELNPICHLLALLGAHHIFHVSRIRVKGKGKGKIVSVDAKMLKKEI